MRREFKFPGLPPFKLYVRQARESCEHFCFVGATVDAVAFLIHYEAYFVVLVGKLAFAFGAVGVYLLHAEERVRREPSAEGIDE